MMLELVQRYFASERQTGIIGFAIGLCLVAAAVLFWQLGGASSLTKGIAVGLVVAGVLHALASGGYAVIVPQRSAETVSRYQGLTDSEVRVVESERMERVLASSFIGGLVLYSSFTVIGLVIMLLSHQAPTRKGVAIAFMIMGVLGNCFESFSMQRNRDYLVKIEALDRRSGG